MIRYSYFGFFASISLLITSIIDIIFLFSGVQNSFFSSTIIYIINFFAMVSYILLLLGLYNYFAKNNQSKISVSLVVMILSTSIVLAVQIVTIFLDLTIYLYIILAFLYYLSLFLFGIYLARSSDDKMDLILGLYSILVSVLSFFSIQFLFIIGSMLDTVSLLLFSAILSYVLGIITLILVMFKSYYLYTKEL